METLKDIFALHISNLQDTICYALEQHEPQARFMEDTWQRPGGGGGRSRILQHGAVFEKAGVNTSMVSGSITPVMRQQLQLDGHYFYAAGLSLVIHPLNPFVPSVHANFRYFDVQDEQGISTSSWFGGGMDLTPYYLFDEDAIHFHQVLKTTCDKKGTGTYTLFKKQCDEYFVNTHRNNEARGIGGLFFDHLQPPEEWFGFVINCSHAFLPAYDPIVQKRKHTVFTDDHRYWQAIRRGRYVEFNLLHDRGTLFGLKTNGRTESIFMSLPPMVRFEYNYRPEPGSEEDKLVQVCLHPKNWI